MAKFKQGCFAHDISKKFHTFYTHVIFGCTRHSSNKFGSAIVGTKILRSTILKQAFIVLTYRKGWHNTIPILSIRSSTHGIISVYFYKPLYV